MKKLLRLLPLLALLSCLDAKASFEKAKRLYNKSRKNTGTIALELYRAELPFSGAIFLREHLYNKRRLNRKLEKLTLDIIYKASLSSFKNLNPDIYRHYLKSPSLNFIAGLEAFQGKNYRQATRALHRIPLSHSLGPESSFILGSAYSLQKNTARAHSYYTKCHQHAKKKSARTENESLKRYFNVIAENCLVHQARLHYEKEDYTKSLQAYNKIQKKSYHWPYLLLEKAWVHYQKGNYNQTLGALVTYKSPLLDSYFLPEADTLRSLSYYRLCLWEESSKVVDEYYNVHLERAKYLEPILLKQKKSPNYFVKLMNLSSKDLKKINPFLKNLVIQIKKKPKVALELSALDRAVQELKQIRKQRRHPLTTKLKKELPETIKWQRSHLNHHVKKQMFSFMNDMVQLSLAMSNIKLKIISQERAYIKKHLVKNPKISRVQGSLRHVKRSVNQYFYKFHGEFWADELGDYSFGLKSQCKKEKI